MKKYIFLMSITAFSLLVFSGCDDDDSVLPTETTKYHEFNHAMRDLWTEHVVWTRNVIINVMDGAPGTTEAVNRLLQNQDDIGDAIKPYYGNPAGDELTTLLRDHINTAAELLTAAKAGNTPAFNAANTAWYANGDEIAAFLHAANPDHFPLAMMKSMMKEHLDVTLEEAVARLEANYAADIVAYDKAYAHIIIMADHLSEGIANQFPDKFE